MSELDKADRQRDQFLAMLAHELSGPLAAVAYAAEAIRGPLSTEDARNEATKIVLEEVSFMRRLVNDLGELFRVGRGNQAMPLESSDLADVVRRASAINRPLIERSGHTFEIILPSSAVRVQGNTDRLVQIVSNLLANAARYTPERGHIRLSIAQDNGTAILKVTDNGAGISKDMLPHVFRPFTRQESARQQYAGGMGIGLAIVQRLVKMHGGTVEAFSAGEGQGSEFVVRLPLSRVRAAPNSSSATCRDAIAGEPHPG